MPFSFPQMFCILVIWVFFSMNDVQWGFLSHEGVTEAESGTATWMPQ